jgi:hypothetical protein
LLRTVLNNFRYPLQPRRSTSSAKLSVRNPSRHAPPHPTGPAWPGKASRSWYKATTIAERIRRGSTSA